MLPPRAFRRFARQFHVSPTREFLEEWYAGRVRFQGRKSVAEKRATARIAESRRRTLEIHQAAQARSQQPGTGGLISRVKRFFSRRRA